MNPPVILMLTMYGERVALKQKQLYQDRGSFKLQNLSLDFSPCPQWSADPSRYQDELETCPGPQKCLDFLTPINSEWLVSIQCVHSECFLL